MQLRNFSLLGVAFAGNGAEIDQAKFAFLEEQAPLAVSVKKRSRSVNFKMASLGLVALLSGAGCVEHAFVAYEKTGIFGDAREVVRDGGGYALRFPYRGGVVTYHPAEGSSWKAEAADGDSLGSVGGSASPALFSARLPHGCLVFACARAEEIRAKAMPEATKSQAVAFKRSDGSGHAFVVYEGPDGVMGEDDRGYRVKLAEWRNRSAGEALRLSRQFSVLTHPAGFPAPVSAEFIGVY